MLHIFDNCIHVKSLWELLDAMFLSDIILPSLTPQIAILGQLDDTNNNNNHLSHVLLIFKWNIHKMRQKLSPIYVFRFPVFNKNDKKDKKQKKAELRITKMVHFIRKPFISDITIQSEKQLLCLK